MVDNTVCAIGSCFADAVVHEVAGELTGGLCANYYTFMNYDLAKRCMYIFAGLLFNEGKLSACVFTEPEMEGMHILQMPQSF